MTLIIPESYVAVEDRSATTTQNQSKMWIISLSLLAFAVLMIGAKVGFSRYAAIGHSECRTEVYHRAKQQSRSAENRPPPIVCRDHGNHAKNCEDRSEEDKPVIGHKVTTCVYGIVSPDDTAAAGTDFAFYSYLATVFFGTIAVFGILLTYSQARDVALSDVKRRLNQTRGGDRP